MPTRIQLARFETIEKKIEELTALSKRLNKAAEANGEKSDAADCIEQAIDNLLDALQSYAVEIRHASFMED